MFGLGTQEIIIILAVALVVFGPKKLPEIGKSLGQGLRELRKASRDIMDSIEQDDEPEPKPAWTPEPASDRPLDQVAETASEEAPAYTPDDALTPVTGSDQEKESVPNAADSNRD